MKTLLLFFLFLFVLGCGVRGAPRPPEKPEFIGPGKSGSWEKSQEKRDEKD